MATKIFCTDIPDFKQLQACALRLSPSILGAYPSLGDSGAVVGDRVVIFHSGLAEALSPEQRAAVIGHELGHIDLGHTLINNSKLGLYQRLAMEYQADHWAVTHGHSAKALISGIEVAMRLHLEQAAPQERQMLREEFSAQVRLRAAALGL